LEQSGYKPTLLEDADYVVVNTCAIKQPTENKVIHFLKKVAKTDKNIVVAGCLTKTNIRRIEKEVPTFSAAIDPQSIDKIGEVINRIERGETKIIKVAEKSPNKLKIPKTSGQSTLGIIQISEGCNMICGYCCARLARGKLQCFPSEDIVNEAKRLVKVGCKELRITSQDNGSYTYKGKRLPHLLKKVCAIKGDFTIRVGMMNPTYVKDEKLLGELIDAYKDEKVQKFLHLPVQSGSNKILRLMKRGYTVEDFVKIVERFRKEIPNLFLSTDVIVGFPEESDADFKATIELMKKIKPNKVNISKFGARPGTEATKMKQLPVEIINERSKRLYGALEGT